MKKVIRILLALALLMLTACDFLRVVAGRPTSKDLAEKQNIIAARKAAHASCDSLALCDSLNARDTESYTALESIDEQIVEIISHGKAPETRPAVQPEVKTTENPMKVLEDMGLRHSSKFSFGEPQSEITSKYNLIIGVYRNEEAARSHFDLALNKGYKPSFIKFENGAQALCLAGSNNPDIILDIVSKADSKVCPDDAWVYVKAM